MAQDRQQERELKLARAKKNMLKKKLANQKGVWRRFEDELLLEDGTTISREWLEDNKLTSYIPNEHRFKRRKEVDR